MRKVIFVIACMFPAIAGYCGSGDGIDPGQELLSLINMKPDEATQQNVSTILGKPVEVDGKKQNVWHYAKGDNNLTIYWNEDATLDKFTFNCTLKEKPALNETGCRKLKMGETCLADAVKALGTPHDMKMRKMNQELHYTYQYNVLNLFFRKGRLVNYTLY